MRKPTHFRMSCSVVFKSRIAFVGQGFIQAFSLPDGLFGHDRRPATGLNDILEREQEDGLVTGFKGLRQIIRMRIRILQFLEQVFFVTDRFHGLFNSFHCFHHAMAIIDVPLLSAFIPASQQQQLDLNILRNKFSDRDQINA